MSLRRRFEPHLKRVRGSEMANAVGLAGAMVINNVIALGSVIVFSRELTDYGSLAALVSYFLILAVVGYAMQVATAREAVLGHLGVGPAMAATIRNWIKVTLLFTVVMTVVSVLARHPIAEAVGSQASVGGRARDPRRLPVAVAVMMRGSLQGLGDYRAVGISLVGEQSARLIIGGVLGDRTRRHRRLYRDSTVVRGHGVLLRRAPAPSARLGAGGTAAHRGVVGARRPGLDGDRRVWA